MIPLSTQSHDNTLRDQIIIIFEKKSTGTCLLGFVEVYTTLPIFEVYSQEYLFAHL